jgi:hypothetical protein
MTAKDKAKELVSRFYLEGSELYDSAIKCALISVDEILDIVQYVGDREYAYWQDVKSELENL